MTMLHKISQIIINYQNNQNWFEYAKDNKLFVQCLFFSIFQFIILRSILMKQRIKTLICWNSQSLKLTVLLGFVYLNQ
jgi:hypothetical protein